MGEAALAALYLESVPTIIQIVMIIASNLNY
jgi:hypothetical protein